MRKNIYNLPKILVVITFCLSLLGVCSVMAEEVLLFMKDVKIIDKSDSTIVNDFSYKNNNINSDLEFYNIGDYIKYEITLFNKSDKDYRIISIDTSNNDKYISYKYEGYNKVIKSNSTGKISVKAVYNKMINKTNMKLQNGNARIKISYEDNNGNVKYRNISINNPNTFDKVNIYFILLFISGLCLILMFIKNKKTKYISLGILVLFTGISNVFAYNNTISINFNDVYRLYNNTIRSDISIDVSDEDSDTVTKDISISYDLKNVDEEYINQY